LAHVSVVVVAWQWPHETARLESPAGDFEVAVAFEIEVAEPVPSVNPDAAETSPSPLRPTTHVVRQRPHDRVIPPADLSKRPMAYPALANRDPSEVSASADAPQEVAARGSAAAGPHLPEPAAVPLDPRLHDERALRTIDMDEGGDHVPDHAPDLSFDALVARAKLRAIPEIAEDALLVARPSDGRVPGGGLGATGRTEAERQGEAREEVRTGRAHPVLYDYLRAAQVRIEPEATRLAEALPLGVSETVRAWTRGFLGGVEEVHRRRDRGDGDVRSGPSGNPDDRANDPTALGRRPDLFSAYGEGQRQAEDGAEERTAEICLGVAPQRPVVVQLRASSGNAALDRLALDSFEVAVAARTVPLDVRPGLACYRVSIRARRVPPFPSLGFGMRKGKVEVIYPLKRLTKVTVELVSIDHGASPQPAKIQTK
jgi:hypothetical protein